MAMPWCGLCGNVRGLFLQGATMLKQLELLIPPVPLTMLFALDMWLIDTYFPGTVNGPYLPFLAYACFVLGSLLILPAAISFFSIKTTVDPRVPQKTRHLVTTGLYRFSRNPMYLGMAIILIGLSVLLGNWLCLALVAMFILYVGHFQIRLEERALLAHFGSEYQHYCQQVRRWL